MIGYLPLPTNTEHKVDIFGLEVPSLRDLRRDRQHLDPARAGAGLGVAYHLEGVRAKGLFGY